MPRITPAAAVLAALCAPRAGAEDEPPARRERLDVRPRLVVGQRYVLASSFSLDAAWGVTSARGSGGGSGKLTSDVDVRFTVETADKAGRPQRVRFRIVKYHVTKSEAIREPEDYERGKQQKRRRLDPDDHPLVGHEVVYDRSAKVPTLQDMGTDDVKAPAVRVEKKYPEILPFLEEVVSPAWAERAPAEVQAGQTWTFDAVRFLHFAGIELPERVHKAEEASRGACTASALAVTGTKATLHYEGEVHGRWETNEWTCGLKGTLFVETGAEPGVVLELDKSPFGFDANGGTKSGLSGAGSLQGGMKSGADPAGAVTTPAAPAAPVNPGGDPGGAPGGEAGGETPGQK